MARQSHNSYHSVREFQREVDTYKDSFDDPSETLGLSSIFMQLFKGHKWVLAVLAAIILVLIAMVMMLMSKPNSPAPARLEAPAAVSDKSISDSDHEALARVHD
jgi:hypothetical protein